MMKVQQLMTSEVASVTAAASLADAAQLMWERDCGFVPVVEPGSGRLRGVITDRDICMGALTQGRPLHEIPVERSMNPSPRSCSPRDDIELVEDVMRTARVRRVPVVDGSRRLVGVLSLNDIATAFARRPRQRGRPTSEDVAATLAAICEHTSARSSRGPEAAPSREAGA